MACDEYPFASTHQDGWAGKPSVAAVPRAESDWQGVTLGVRSYGNRSCQPFGDRTPFVVVAVPQPFVPTFPLCR